MRRIVVAAVLGALASACGGDDGKADVVFAIGPNGSLPEFSVVEPAEFVFDSVVYHAEVLFSLESDSDSPCTVDGTQDSHAFAIEINDATGAPYAGPVEVSVEAIPKDALAFVAIDGACVDSGAIARWPGGLLGGTVSLGDKMVEDVEGAGQIGLRVTLGVPGTDDIVIVPGEGALSERDQPYDPGAPPGLGDHWHAAFGIYACDAFLPPPSDQRADETGIHTHDDGLIHIHPFSTSFTGAGANLESFLDQVGIRLDDDTIRLADGTSIDADEGCDGEPAELATWVWDSATGGGTPTSDAPADIAFTQDSMVIVVAVTPAGTDVPLPPSVPELASPSDVG